MKESIVNEKSYKFALRIIKLYKYLIDVKKEYVLSKQLLRSGTSIGANIEEAYYAQTKKDFISKMSISLKEAAETKYWLRLLRDSETLNDKQVRNLIVDCEEIIKILTSTLNTAKKNVP